VSKTWINIYIQNINEKSCGIDAVILFIGQENIHIFRNPR